ncbi:BLUF domain-containing protein [Psychroflexus salis]|nr:BLUF domain-containing protein [Psychroflexus salis]
MSNQANVLNEKDVEDLLYQVREKNRKLAITGLLLLIQGKFIQYIEGPPEEIDKVYIKIKKDPRHSDLLLLDKGVLEDRLFSDWSMAYRKIKDSEIENIIGFKDLELDKLFFQDEETRSKHPVLKVLYNFIRNLT